jgi:predicted short-subunit dehydrogenase-like oxidoreductase (DUF2520 family)
MTVSIIGAGNLAWHLVNVFEDNNIRVAEVFSRTKKKAESITGYLYDVVIKTDLDFTKSPSEVFILAITDDAILEVASKMSLPQNAILVHSSGAKGLKDLLPSLDKNYDVKLGVFYPLMTFTKGLKVDFEAIPICVEGENESVYKHLEKLANKISKRVFQVNSEQRAVLHVAAVFACNFTNHLWALSKEIAEEESLDFDILKPLIQETFNKAMKADHPSDVQTGPAVREDNHTLQKHRQILKDDSDLLNVYDSLTKSIQDWHQ